MAIARPTTKTIISTTGWGIPVTDQLNTNTTDIATVKPLVPGAWVNLTLLNGWVAVANRATPSIRLRGDIVDMRGMVTGGANQSQAFLLPVGYRPSGIVELLCYQWPSVPSWCIININTAGAAVISAASGTPSSVSLELRYCVSP